jgi:hypothetical protein
VVEVEGWCRRQGGQNRNHCESQPQNHLQDSCAIAGASALVVEFMATDKEALLDEERKLRRLCRAMDLTAALLWRVDLTLEEARDVIDHAKQTALQLFPGKEETFDLIYGSRFRRILTEKYRLQ